MFCRIVNCEEIFELDPLGLVPTAIPNAKFYEADLNQIWFDYRVGKVPMSVRGDNLDLVVNRNDVVMLAKVRRWIVQAWEGYDNRRNDDYNID